MDFLKWALMRPWKWVISYKIVVVFSLICYCVDCFGLEKFISLKFGWVPYDIEYSFLFEVVMLHHVLILLSFCHSRMFKSEFWEDFFKVL